MSAESPFLSFKKRKKSASPQKKEKREPKVRSKNVYEKKEKCGVCDPAHGKGVRLA